MAQSTIRPLGRKEKFALTSKMTDLSPNSNLRNEAYIHSNFSALKVAIIVGTRPNFIKITRFKALGEKLGIEVVLIHTGQHFDHNMAGVFFEQFGVEPDLFLDVERSEPGSRLGEALLKLSEVFQKLQPDYVIAVGDVDSTLACSLAANKQACRLVHLESGLRSFDRSMPEEINREITDKLADILLVTEESGMRHLLAEGKSDDQIHFVGNTMIDTMVHFEKEIDQSPIVDDLKLEEGQYILATFHRPALVDTEEGVLFLTDLVESLTKRHPLVLPLHPRTKKAMERFGSFDRFMDIKSLVITEPMGYFEFQSLIKRAAYIVTDSGGIQEETTFRQLPCLTVRPNTERPVTITSGTNTLVTTNVDEILALADSIDAGGYKTGVVPPLWDGHATERCLQVLVEDFKKTSPQIL